MHFYAYDNMHFYDAFDVSGRICLTEQSHINKCTMSSTLYVTVIASPWKPLLRVAENQREYE